MTPRTYKTRAIYAVRRNSASETPNYSIGIPREYGDVIAGQRFQFTLTDQGILYVPVGDLDESEEMEDLPAWAKKNS